MAKVKLKEFAMARSGDKGDGSNVGVFVTNAADYEVIKRELTVDRVKQHFHDTDGRGQDACGHL